MNTLVKENTLVNRIDEVEKLIGNTPLYRIRNAFQKPGVEIYAKLEWQQLGQSVKARPAFYIMKDAILKGELHPGKRLLDASSGNTAIAYASIGAALGIGVTICLPENASRERKTLLMGLGAEVVLTPAGDGTDGAQEEARTLARQRPDQYFYADQYSNPNNWQAHYHTTAREIFYQTNGRITHFVAGLGTTGSFTGTGKKLKEVVPGITLVSLQPETALHGLEGWKHLETVKVPNIYDDQLAHQEQTVDTLSAYEWVRRFARGEGMLISPSAGANLAGAVQLAQQIEEGVIVTLFADDASKYSEVIQSIF